MDDLAAAAAIDDASAVVDPRAKSQARAKRRLQKPAEAPTVAPRQPALARPASSTVLDC